jgi:hypothetical protein
MFWKTLPSLFHRSVCKTTICFGFTKCKTDYTDNIRDVHHFSVFEVRITAVGSPPVSFSAFMLNVLILY